MNQKMLILLSFVFCACSVQQIQQALEDYSKPTTNEVIAGLKQALEKGSSKGASEASQVDGYFRNPQIKIPFPPDVQQVADKLTEIGLGNEVERFVKTLNRGAEEAAKEAAPIFINAVKGMSIQDGWNILKGEDDAATQYLKANTSSALTAKFSPVIQKALDKTEATRYYADLVNTYNKIPFVKDVNPDLNDYATQKALDGLFLLVAKEEKNIRENPVARTTELLKKVFAQQD